MEALKDQLVEIDSRWTIDELKDISYTELYTMVDGHPTNVANICIFFNECSFIYPTQ